MAKWLVKTEPSDYSFDDLARDGRTTWTGVKNAQALIHLRAMRKGDDVLIYHTGGEKSVFGKATVVSAKDGEVELEAGKKLWRPVAISEIRPDPFFTKWDLIRNSRLSVMPVPDAIWKRIDEMSGAVFTNTKPAKPCATKVKKTSRVAERTKRK